MRLDVPGKNGGGYRGEFVMESGQAHDHSTHLSLSIPVYLTLSLFLTLE